VKKLDPIGTAQVTLAWAVQRGTVAVTQSTNVEHQKENLNVRNFSMCSIESLKYNLFQLPTLDEKDMEVISSVDKNTHLFPYPGPKDKPFGWTYEQLGW
jgi:diketogulonate reductase-like aldo/keto reductase